PRKDRATRPLLATPDHRRPLRGTMDRWGPPRPLQRPRAEGGPRTMLAVAERVVAPRYGSVADLAAYASLSRKTIRRLIESGAIRGLKVGRRVLIPFEDMDRHILRMEEHRPPG